MSISHSSSNIFAQHLLPRSLMKFSQGKCKFLHLGRKNPGHQYMLGATQSKAAWQGRTWEANNRCLWQRQRVVPWAALGVLPAGWGRWAFSSTQHQWGHTWSAVSSSGLLHTWESGMYLRQSREWLWRWWRDQSISPMGKGWESWDYSAWRREGSEGHINVYKCLKG